MTEIHILSSETINRIAAGEVVDRPASIVKELTENAIDAGASAVAVEIRDGGIGLIRVTDNGCGIDRSQIPVAFRRHTTSKITDAADLDRISTLGFRGEALSSIAAVSRVELMTKTRDSLTGTRYVIEGGEEKKIEEIGTVDGTTFLVRDLFWNTPARRKFLKSANAEAAAVFDLTQRLALSHPEISVRLIVQGRERFHTSGNGNLKDAVYAVLGRDFAASLLPVDFDGTVAHVTGFVGRPDAARANRGMEFYFINGRYIRNHWIMDGIEEAFHSRLMQHQYPFTVLLISVPVALTDVNVHPSKMEIRFRDPMEVRHCVLCAVEEALKNYEMIPDMHLKGPDPAAKTGHDLRDPYESAKEDPVKERRFQEEAGFPTPPFQAQVAEAPAVYMAGPSRDAADSRNRDSSSRSITGSGQDSGRGAAYDFYAGSVSAEEPEQKSSPALLNANEKDTIESYNKAYDQELADMAGSLKYAAVNGQLPERFQGKLSDAEAEEKEEPSFSPEPFEVNRREAEKPQESFAGVQQTLFENRDFQEKNRIHFHIIGQVFSTYWLIEYEDKVFFIDQHAAHEKVIYERLMKQYLSFRPSIQYVSPPLILTLSPREKLIWEEEQERLAQFGFLTSDFGNNDISVSGVPTADFHLSAGDLLQQFLKDLSEGKRCQTAELIAERIATMSCKAAVKGNNRLSVPEAEELIRQMLESENPYCCPHGRPSMIELSQTELEKQFHRIV